MREWTPESWAAYEDMLLRLARDGKVTVRAKWHPDAKNFKVTYGSAVYEDKEESK